MGPWTLQLGVPPLGQPGGAGVGALVGALVVGAFVGAAVGALVGPTVGALVGLAVGASVGALVGVVGGGGGQEHHFCLGMLQLLRLLQQPGPCHCRLQPEPPPLFVYLTTQLV